MRLGLPTSWTHKIWCVVKHLFLVFSNNSILVLVCPARRTGVNCGIVPDAQSCTSDNDCENGQKCCEDGCFEENICKPGFFLIVKPENKTTEYPEAE